MNETRQQNTDAGANDNLNFTILVEKIRNGDESAFSELFRSYYSQLYRFARRYVKNKQAAEDIAQDVFVNIWRNREKWRIRTSLRSYLYTAVRNRALNHLKRAEVENRRAEIAGNITVPATTPEGHLHAKEIEEKVYKAIEELPVNCRQIFMLKKFDSLSYSEIAEIHGISVNTVKTQLSRAVKFLLKQLAPLLSSFGHFFAF